MPFNNSLMNNYIQKYDLTPDADCTDSRFSRAILLIYELRELARDPFMLKLPTVITQLMVARADFEYKTWKDATRGGPNSQVGSLG